MMAVAANETKKISRYVQTVKNVAKSRTDGLPYAVKSKTIYSLSKQRVIKPLITIRHVRVYC